MDQMLRIRALGAFAGLLCSVVAAVATTLPRRPALDRAVSNCGEACAAAGPIFHADEIVVEGISANEVAEITRADGASRRRSAEDQRRDD